MARREADREDLMREAVALAERVELGVAGQDEPVVAGFHADGRLSVYFGADPVYHFDARGRLRRAFSDGCLYRSQGTTLARLTRERSAGQTTLRRVDLGAQELQAFLDAAHARMAGLAAAIEAGTAVVLRQVPAAGDIAPRLLASLRDILAATLALAPAMKR